MRAVEVERAGQRNNGAMAWTFGKHDQTIWPVAIVSLAMLTPACAAPELTTLVAGGTEMAGPTEPTLLAEAELDSITAAGVVVDVASFAAGRGDLVLASTNADTVALSREAYDLGLGFTRGSAFACCSENSDVVVGSTVAGIGDYVRGNTYAVRAGEQDAGDGRRKAYGHSLGFVLALSFRKHWGGDRHERDAMVGELEATYADLDTHFQATALDLHFPDAR